MKYYDVVIIGGGAAGMMASISIKRNFPNKSVVIIDRTFALGRKLLVCGAGRCNITNFNLSEKIDTSYYGASTNFIHSVFDQFGFKEIKTFFNELGVELYVEQKTDIGKLFPITNQATTITELLIDEINRLGIEVYLNHNVNTIVKNITNRDNPSQFLINTSEINREGLTINKKEFTSEKIILSAGGKSYPALGSDGSGYELARNLGHFIIKPIPAALPLETTSNQWSHLLQGQKVEATATSIINEVKVKASTDEVMFKKYGLSGPAILNISREISIHILRENLNNSKVSLNFFPNKSKDEVFELLQNRWGKRKDQTVEKSLYGLFPNKIASAIVKILEIDTIKINSKEDIIKIHHKLADRLTNIVFNISNTRGWNEAEFTAGGVDSNEINITDLESKLVKGLHFCGEIIDVDGDVGGFNLSWSWASGYVVGKNIFRK